MNMQVHSNRGFSYVKMAVLLGLVSIFGILMLPGLQNDTIRTRVTQSLNLAEPAKQALLNTCQSKSSAVVSRNAQAGYAFFETMYVADVRLSADCKEGTMEVRIRTQNTGAATDPEIVLLGQATAPESGADWRCSLAKGEPSHVPNECRLESQG